MRKLVLLLLLTGVAAPALAAKRVTVEQLEQALAAARGRPDTKVAEQLSELELTERLSEDKLSRWVADLPGPESKRSLVLLTDVSAFLDPPAAEIPSTAAPDIAMQRRLIALTTGYVSKTIRQLPNFLATRDTIRFEDTPQGHEAETSLISYQPLHAVSRSTETVLYRDGREVVDSDAEKGKQSQPAAQGLTTQGLFGAILGTVLVDAGQGKLAWDHWEQGADGPQAVFHYTVPREESHYEVEFCCVPGNGGTQVFQQLSAYHGEIAVDPTDGSILRLVVAADLKRSDPIVRSDILVEYSGVEIGGEIYICPVKSISISRAPALPPNAYEMARYRGELVEQGKQTLERLQTSLNEVVFEQYHLFRSDARVRTGENVTPAGNAPASAPAGLAESPVVTAKETVNETDIHAAENPPPVPPVTPAAATIPTAAAAPEISVAVATGLPDTAIPRPASLETNFSLHATARLVDVGVLAYDKKGNPVADLKLEDFEIYDNGRKQVVRLFSRAAVRRENRSPLQRTSACFPIAAPVPHT